MEIELKPNVSIQDDYEEVLTILKEQLVEYTQNNATCNETDPSSFCFDSNSVIFKEVNPPTEYELCQQRVPANFSKLYFPHYFGSNLSCVSHCTKGAPDAINCNYGDCRLLTTGPQCYCSDPDIYWYTGERCHSRVNKIAVYGGFGVVLAVLGIAVITVTLLWQRNKKKEHHKSNSHSDQEGKWYEDEWDSSISEGFTFRNSRAANWEDQEGTGHSSSKEKLKLDLEKVDTTLKIQVQRPEIANSLSTA